MSEYERVQLPTILRVRKPWIGPFIWCMNWGRIVSFVLSQFTRFDTRTDISLRDKIVLHRCSAVMKMMNTVARLIVMRLTKSIWKLTWKMCVEMSDERFDRFRCVRVVEREYDVAVGRFFDGSETESMPERSRQYYSSWESAESYSGCMCLLCNASAESAGLFLRSQNYTGLKWLLE